MEKNFKRTTVTSALPYANGPVHIGHLAGVYVPADIYVRYLRLKKEDVLFIGGSDEHGVPITIRAKKEGITPQDVVDRYHKIIKDSFEEFGISFDVYGRTTSKVHRETASEFFRTLYDKGEFVEKTSMQYYEGAEGKVLYVWFDAPIGYISNTKELLPESWETWWKDPETKMVHFIGKDNIVFHCIVFPAMLKAEGSYNLPENVPANEFLNLEGDKISTSRNWAVWLNEYLVDMPGKQDVLRYVLTANAPETKDNDFTWKDFQARNNNELVAILGNFVNRALVLTEKYFEGKVPAAGELTDYDRQTLTDFANVKADVERLLDTYHFRDAQKEAMNLARIGNKYLADTEPWKLAKTDMARVATIMNIALQITANLAIAFEPFLPFSMEKLNKMLNVEPLGWNRLGSTDLLEAGHQLGKSELLFEKIEDSVIEAQVQKLLDTKKANEEANYRAKPIRENIEFDDFMKLDIRVGTVLECTKVPKADKLLQLAFFLLSQVRTH